VTGVGLLTAGSAGTVLGIVFFGGLWWTVRRGLTAAMPALWFGLSALGRMAFVLCGLYCFARLGLTSLIACLCGLLVGRVAVKHFTRLTT
jgi:F1F0 ATPase subunit 2